ncbi:MAG TPA: asparaginase [Microcella sp.]|nr:asparaginase [Microcella sp.]
MNPPATARPTRAPLDVAGSSELAVIERSGLIESRHIGAAVIVDATGTRLLTIGDVDATVFPRSTLKPLQAVALLEAGAAFADDELVLATASHCGSPAHLAVVERMLTADGRSPDALQCPADWPLGAAERAARRAAGLGPAPLAMNCSGKHAGFLRAADALVAAGDATADPARYLDPAHPVQRHITATIERMLGEPIRHTGVDGCGAPLHATSLAALATAIARVASGSTAESARLMRAVAAEPWAIDGVGRANTRVIETLGGIAKIGAEGLVVIGLPGGVAAAVKVLDGGMRATTPVALELLRRVGAVDATDVAELRAELDPAITGGADVVGGLIVTA